MPQTHILNVWLSDQRGEWLLLWRPAPRDYLLSRYDWSAAHFFDKASIAFELWRRFGDPKFDIAPSPRCAGAVFDRAPRRWSQFDFDARVEVYISRPDGLPASIWPLLDFGAALARESGQERERDRSSHACRVWRAHPMWNGDGPVPGTGVGAGARRWGPKDRQERLGAGSRKRAASDVLAAREEALDLFEEKGVMGSVEQDFLRSLRRAADKQLSMMPNRYDDTLPRRPSLPDRGARAKAASRARGEKPCRWLESSE